ncbi:uncharacterized protein EV154DRAFT_568535 [Mucor mucedo]|uniref:uncharacterized protein n=1 Tax=Mucor mucedo TaxID=29922 RepID=UPI00221E82D7|nr:uncharacterized protein EV154DRAFT_568535 [Mucor mucedo]KAI7880292.1 hypothetical protein EV154DRAFT_568535 [Mucor mucedo]
MTAKFLEEKDTFETAEEFLDACDIAATHLGFQVYVKDSSPLARNGFTRCYQLTCVFGIKIKRNTNISEQARKRLTSANSKNCPFMIHAILPKKGKKWVVKECVAIHTHDMLEQEY